MATFHACPNCSRKPSGGLFGGSWFSVYACRGCGQRYCYGCPGSHQAKECPRCGSSKQDDIGKVTL